MTEINTDFEKDELAVDPATFPVDRYEPIRMLGQGALGYVYLCKDRNLGKKVAVKCLLSITNDKVMMFHKEARIASRLNHEHVIHIFDFGTSSGGNPFMAMEYFEGCSLETLLAQRGPLDEYVAITLFVTICDALSYIHSNGIFHRDLKPTNILVAEKDDELDVRLIDFNLSKTTVDVQFKTIVNGRTVVGTPAYMSPDQISGQAEYDEISEVYSVGCVMYEALTGELPFPGTTSLEILNSHLYSDVVSALTHRPNLSTEINDVLVRCLNKRRDQRFQSIEDLRDQLKAIIAPPIVGEYDDSSKYGARHVSTPRQRQAVFALFGLILVSGILALWAAAPYVLPEKEPKTRTTSYHRLSDVGVRMLDHVSDTKSLLSRKIENKDRSIRLPYNATDDDVKILVTYKELHEVNLSDCAVTEEGIAYLAQLPHLTTLKLDGTAIKTLDGIDKLSELRLLSIRKVHIDSEIALENVAKLKNLHQLWLERTTISDHSLSKLLPIASSLSHIDLSGTGLTDKGFLQLKEFKNLKHIQVKKSAITRKTAQELVTVFSLDTLILAECPNVSFEDVLALENEFPATKFAYNRTPRILQIRNDAKDLADLRKYRDARNLLESAVKIVKEKYGTNSPILIQLYAEIAGYSHAMHDEIRADKEFRNSLDLAESNNFYLAGYTAATALLELEPNLPWKKKETIFLRRVTLAEKESGNLTKLYFDAVAPLAIGLATVEQYARALPWLDLTLAAGQGGYGDNSKEVMSTLVCKGSCLSALRRPDESDKTFFEVLALLRGSAPDMVELGARTRLGLASNEFNRNQMNDALAQNTEALKLVRAHQVPKHLLDSVFEQRIQLLTAMKNKVEAEEVRQEFKLFGKD
ncbi:MAG: protein kinase [Candidatus Obscuribacterales bacterium]|nr:protein kinase [Candidatus Obscuribacterales bacterium]